MAQLPIAVRTSAIADFASANADRICPSDPAERAFRAAIAPSSRCLTRTSPVRTASARGLLRGSVPTLTRKSTPLSATS
jgi:predicted secreted protein